MSYFSTRLVNIQVLIYLTIINIIDLVFFESIQKQCFHHKVLPLSFVNYQEITDFRYFRNISLLISQLYFDVTLFNLKILTVLDSCFRSSFFNPLGPL